MSEYMMCPTCGDEFEVDEHSCNECLAESFEHLDKRIAELEKELEDEQLKYSSVFDANVRLQEENAELKAKGAEHDARVIEEAVNLISCDPMTEIQISDLLEYALRGRGEE